MDTSTRWSLEEAGLYKQHSVDSPLIRGFPKYLETSGSKEFIRRQVNFVTRYLYFVDSQEVSLKCLDQPERTVDFFNQLEASGVSQSTAINHLDSNQKFARYISMEPRCLDDPSANQAVSRFVELLNDIRKKINKKAAKGRKEMGYQLFLIMLV
ncbi:uncharacterized protein LOC143929775 [Lithobates pipiens]